MADPTPWGQFFTAAITACLTSVNDLFREGVSTCLFLSSNQSSLNNSLRSLEAVAEKLKINVEDEETSLRRVCSPDVREWLKKVKKVAIRAKTLLANDQSSCGESQHDTCSSCKASPIHRFRIGRRVIQTLGEVNSLLIEGGQFTPPFTSPPRAAAVLFQPIDMPIFGIDAVMRNLWGQFNNKRMSIIGLHGLAGISKTTVLKRFNNELREQRYDDRYQFQVVIMLEVANAEKLNVVGMQRIISDRLGLRWDEGESDINRATLLHRALTKKKFVVLLDNVWEKFDLADVGIPTPVPEGNGSKLIIASRSESVCGSMGVSRSNEMYCLQKNDAWQLFLSKLTEKVKVKVSTNNDVKKYAREIVESCGGLPLAIKVIGFALTASDIPEAWYHVAATIKQNPSSIKGIDQMLTVLKYSYDMLDEKEKKCFLYCTMFPDYESIPHKQLVDYWVAEALISPETHEGYSIIGKLLSACLLQRSERDPASEVKMHQMILIMGRQQAVVSGTEQRKKTCRTKKKMQNKGKDRKLEEKAALCSSEPRKRKYNAEKGMQNSGEDRKFEQKTEPYFSGIRRELLIKPGQALERAPDMEEWEEATRISLMFNNIIELSISPNCQKLLTLLLQNNPNLHQLCPKVFDNMPTLKVLDLSHTAISLLPDCSRLRQLVHLNLSHTPIKELPVQLCNELVELQYLNISHTLITELCQQLAKLKKLTQLNLEETLVLKVIPHGIISMLLRLKYLNLYKSGYGVKDLPDLNLEELWKLTFLGITIHSQQVFHNMRMSDPVARCTHLLSLSRCSGMKSIDLLEFKMMSNLTKLHIESCNDLEELIFDCDYPADIARTAVKVLTLDNLPNLIKVSNGRMWDRFEELLDLTIHNCPKLEDASWALRFSFLERLVISNCDCLKQLKSEESVPETSNRRIQLQMDQPEVKELKPEESEESVPEIWNIRGASARLGTVQPEVKEKPEESVPEIWNLLGASARLETVQPEVKELKPEESKESVPEIWNILQFQFPVESEESEEAPRVFYRRRNSYYLESITVDNCPNLTKLPWRKTCPNLKQICGEVNWWETIEPKEKADLEDLFVPI